MPCQEVLDSAKTQHLTQGIPESLKFHGGWKKWRLEVCGIAHTFESREVGVQAALWIRDAQKELEGASRKVLQSHLQAAGVKVPRTKDDMATALIRFRYKAKDFGCICCQEAREDVELESPIPIPLRGLPGLRHPKFGFLAPTGHFNGTALLIFCFVLCGTENVTDKRFRSQSLRRKAKWRPLSF